ncbi:hypothetical protein [Bradyrhizobium cosmicum]|uniref:hypothetical protein n=1 Tax=Bradyrhizobium cosmicum TaxID=1404864 RepID=UPI0028E6FFCA|nr:hypothetical protein [Bradyrhizobium cosmicum]
MKYGDFASIVQLGVGLHIGTAVLQLYGEIGAEPLVRALSRIRTSIDDLDQARGREARDEYEQLASDYEIFKIRLFNEYKNYIKINSLVASTLFVLLVAIAFKNDDPIEGEWMMVTIPIVAMAFLPALATLGSLWFDASRLANALKVRADALEQRVLRLGLVPR